MASPETSAARRLLDLTIEYQQSVDNRSSEYAAMGEPHGRDPEVIAEDYATTLRDVLSS